MCQSYNTFKDRKPKKPSKKVRISNFLHIFLKLAQNDVNLIFHQKYHLALLHKQSLLMVISFQALFLKTFLVDMFLLCSSSYVWSYFLRSIDSSKDYRINKSHIISLKNQLFKEIEKEGIKIIHFQNETDLILGGYKHGKRE